MSRAPDKYKTSQPEGLELRAVPRTTRLNRNALILGGVLGAAVLFAAAATLVQSRTPIPTTTETAHVAAAGTDRFWDDEPDGVPVSPESVPPDVEVAAPPEPEPNVVPASTDRGLLSTDSQRRYEQRSRARDAAPLVAGVRSGDLGAGASPVSSAGPAANRTGMPDSHPEMLGALSNVLQGEDETLRQNNQEAKLGFLGGSGISDQQETNAHLVRRPASAYEVTAGMIIPAVLLTQGDSDLPGLITGRVRENVNDSATGRHLLIPQGTMIIGVYDSVVTFGQERLLIAWQRLIFPDGTKLNIGGMPGTDLIGAAGLRDQVDRHYTSVFGGALLLSALTAAGTLSQEDDNGSHSSEGSTRDHVKRTLATALGQGLGDVSSQLIRREMNVQPTLRVRPGTRFNVLVNKDLVFDGPYLNTFVGGGLVP